MGRRLKLFVSTVLVIVGIGGFFACTEGFLEEIKEKVREESEIIVPKYRVVYDGNGNDGGKVPVDEKEYAKGESVTVLGNEGELERSGYVFVGWNTEADGSGETYVEGDKITMGDADIRLYAMWVLEVVKLIAPDAQDDLWFGYRVAVDGEYAVIGCGFADLYVFQRVSFNEWNGGIKLVSPGSRSSVAIDNGYIVAGSSGNDTKATDAGAVKVFYEIGDNAWDTGVMLFAPDAEESDYFGYSVDIDGDYIVVGAYGEDTNGTDSGAAYVFHRIGVNGWDEGVKLEAFDGEASDNFGYSVAISGDYIVVGAPYEDEAGTDAGAIYVFHRTGTNAWDLGTKILSSDGEAGDDFGYSVGIDGDYIIAGAIFENSKGYRAGAAYVFQRGDGTSWNTGTKIVAPDGAAIDYFGSSVAIDGEFIVVGAHVDDNENGTDAGGIYLFSHAGDNDWSFEAKIVAPGGTDNDYFGRSVDINGKYIIAGAYGNDAEGSNAGASYIKITE